MLVEIDRAMARYIWSLLILSAISFWSIRCRSVATSNPLCDSAGDRRRPARVDLCVWTDHRRRCDFSGGHPQWPQCGPGFHFSHWMADTAGLRERSIAIRQKARNASTRSGDYPDDWVEYWKDSGHVSRHTDCGCRPSHLGKAGARRALLQRTLLHCLTIAERPRCHLLMLSFMLPK